MPSYALNFYSPIVEAQLKSHRKTATIRLGDKSRKYQKGMIVSVLCGARFSPRQHVFDAVIDKVEVKTIGELSPNEIEHDNPEIRHADELCRFLGQLYNRDVTESRHGDPDPLLGDQALLRLLGTGRSRVSGAHLRCGCDPSLVGAFYVMRRSRAAGEHPAAETAADRERNEQEFEAAERYQEEWREEQHQHGHDTQLP